MLCRTLPRVCQQAAAAAAAATSGIPHSAFATDAERNAAAAASSSTGHAPVFPPFEYKMRARYSPLFASRNLSDFMFSKGDQIMSVACTYTHEPSQVQVTLIPLVHYAHPQFFQQVDSLCCQHDSVLMEGRVPNTGAPHSTLVPPRSYEERVRPIDEEDSEGWEPHDAQRYWQPFSWGVKGSPKFTVIHAADRYDYERLPWWASLRFNIPLVGSYAREKHCMDMISPLVGNGYKSFAVPWGAAHAPIFHDMLTDHGFEQTSMCTLIVWSKIDGDRSSAEWTRMDTKLRFLGMRTAILQTFALIAVLIVASPHLIGFTSQTEEDESNAYTRRQRNG
ncbi:membrane-associated protein, putative [Bodo saltans]|uniref:Membrane-associated protein, putative n=1 Tax=Bodo saltans TaxID=75058 RepID=A0A0S4JJX8_BODSA|nr:membrane-associated protein, putative [Bodo saltans]|eukprot:CUG91823.1 membrane-associated protein, putative [Bodo saltans]